LKSAKTITGENQVLLSRQKKDDLEDRALLAFSGKSEPFESGNGFRISRDGGQVAAIYWSENLPDNDVEIAVCDSRVTTQYDLRTVKRWIDREQRLATRECNIHKHGSEWPILGFSYNGALEFLARVAPLRKGALPNDLLQELSRPQPDNRDDTGENLRLELARLRPTVKKAVIDLVKAAGIDVSCWYVNTDGTRSEKPRSNPAYCFNWSFGGENEPLLACLWHASMKIDNDRIIFDDNLRDAAAELQAIADSTGEAQKIRNRARAQARRARAVDAAFAEAHSATQSMRVIVNEGLRRPADMLGKESSKVELRILDAMTWRVQHYNPTTGQMRLTREIATVSVSPPSKPATSVPAFVDQYVIGADQVRRKELTGTAYERSRAIRDAVLARASGVCELCGKRGFQTAAGSIFLETHHVVPLSENGADRVENVVAICPNDHREAHYGRDAGLVKEQLQAILRELYAPDDAA
jgi:5-methylcytosine-specific restriction protein A